MASPQTKPGVSKARLEALSDGLFAIVMTLLIFQLMSTLTSDAKNADDLHSALHMDGNETSFFAAHGIHHAVELALALYENTGNEYWCNRLLQGWKI